MRRAIHAGLVGLAIAACGIGPPESQTSLTDAPITTMAPPDSTVTSAEYREVGCGNGGTPRFPESFLTGPQLTREEFALTPLGEEMESFFVSGPASAGEGGLYLDSVGFSVVPDTLVLGYWNDQPSAFFIVESGKVREWGTCSLVLVSDDLIASRWDLTQALSPEMTIIPIRVDGGACVTDTGTDVLTELVRVDVQEDRDNVEIVTWTRQESFEGICAGVGIMLEAEAELSSPLEARDLWDGGTIPTTRIDQQT